jgi:hypothetical protein
MKWQREILTNKAKNKILRIGRRAGKTELIVRLAIAKALLKPKQNIAIFSVNYNQAKNVVFKRFEEVAHSSWDLRSGDSLQIRLPNGSVIYIISGEQPNSIRGYNLHFAFLDEAAFLLPELFTQVVKPALLTTQGGVFICSTPKGMNWFFHLWESVKDNPDWALFHLPSSVNEFITAADIEEQRQLLSEAEFREEILAEFVNQNGAVFRNITKVATIYQPDIPDNHIDPRTKRVHSFVMGIDWGQSNDYSVFTVMCVDCKCVVDWLRFNKIDFIYQRDRLKELHSKWNCFYILAEANSIGKPNIEMLWQDGLPVQAFNMTAQSKPPLIRGLVLSLEQEQIKIPSEYIGELQGYESKQSASGHISYSAPSKMHDDRVISLALAEHARKIGTGFGVVLV